MNKKLVIPMHFLIETVCGKCNATCNMCLIKKAPRNEIMNNETFTKILKRIKPYLDYQKFLSFCGLGETLIDKEIDKKIKIAKETGFHGIGVYTNGMLLNAGMSEKLLEASLDSLIISIDGFSSAAQESIRKGTKLGRIIKNIDDFISIRESNNIKTKIIIRFHRQSINYNEWNDFYGFWNKRLKNNFSDSIACYDVHNIGGNISFANANIEGLESNKKLPKCNQIYERLQIFSDGSVGLCCGDVLGRINIGNVLYDDPIKLYNSGHFAKYREYMENGKILDLKLCKECTVPYSTTNKNIMNV